MSDNPELRFDENYFTMYREDPKRVAMYEQEIARIEKFKSSGRVLDVGCGIGVFLEKFSAQKWDRYGVDVSDVAIKEARARGIKVREFHEAYDYPDSFFDVIIFRGSLQLIPAPFSVIRKCIDLLAPGGYLIFLATPNSNSIYYRRFRALPFLTPHLNYLIPSDVMMENALSNFGLETVLIHYPYLGSPYAKPVRDHLYFALSFLGLKKKFAFWKSSMEIYARKPLRGGNV